MATPIEAVQAQLDALDRRLAGEHVENREALKEIKQTVESLDGKVDQVVSVGVRHDEQIKTIQRGGGGVIGLISTVVGALLVEWLRRTTGGH